MKIQFYVVLERLLDDEPTVSIIIIVTTHYSWQIFHFIQISNFEKIFIYIFKFNIEDNNIHLLTTIELRWPIFDFVTQNEFGEKGCVGECCEFIIVAAVRFICARTDDATDIVQCFRANCLRKHQATTRIALTHTDAG